MAICLYCSRPKDNHAPGCPGHIDNRPIGQVAERLDAGESIRNVALQRRAAELVVLLASAQARADNAELAEKAWREENERLRAEVEEWRNFVTGVRMLAEKAEKGISSRVLKNHIDEFTEKMER